MVDHFFDIILFFCNYYFWGPFLVFGALYIDRSIFAKTFIVVFFGSMFNVYLKSIWQIPLHPSLGANVGFSFPSGHAHFNFVLWAVLCLQFKNKWLYVVAIFLNVANWFAMVHYNYHIWADIFAAVGFGMITTSSIMLWNKFFHNKNAVLGLIYFALMILFYHICHPIQKASWMHVYIGVHFGATIHVFVHEKKIFSLLYQKIPLYLKIFEYGSILSIMVFLYHFLRNNKFEYYILFLYGTFFIVFALIGCRLIAVYLHKILSKNIAVVK